MYSAEQIQDARRRQVETLLGLAGKSFEGVERLVALNLRTTKSAIDDASQAAMAALNSRDIPSLLQVRLSRVQPAAEKASAYGRDVAEIFSATGAELTRFAEAAASEARERLLRSAAAVKAQAEAIAPAAAAVAERAAETVAESVDQATEEVAQTLQAAANEGTAAVEAATEPSISIKGDASPKTQTQTPSRGKRSAA